MNNEKLYFWLTTGHAVFQENETGRVFRTREYNGLVKTKTKAVILKEVSGVQNALFARASQEVDQTTVTTVDIVVTNLMLMGHFTEAEFTAGTSVVADAAKKMASDEMPKFQ